jgi:hypothetical protein
MRTTPSLSTYITFEVHGELIKRIDLTYGGGLGTLEAEVDVDAQTMTHRRYRSQISHQAAGVRRHSRSIACSELSIVFDRF